MRRHTISEPDFIEGVRADGGSVAVGIARTARPNQWLKNLLVFTAPLAAGTIADGPTLLAATVAFAAFCLSASAVYFVNDVADVEADRGHPRKRNRPIAAGILAPHTAIGIAIVLFLGGLALALIEGPPLLIVIACYDAIQLAYCFWLKHQPILDIAVVSSGFLLRAIAGGVATGAIPTQWFLLVAVFGSLLIVAGKRYGEIIVEQSPGTVQRGSLQHYTPTYLRFVWQMCAAGLVLSYSLWAFAEGSLGLGIWVSISVAPFLLAVIRYCQHVDRGDAEAPEDIALHDRMLQVLAALWLVVLGIGLYVSPLFG